MTCYLIAIHRHATYDPATQEDVAMHRAIDALNDAMVAAGVRIFVGGLQPVGRARAIRRGSDGQQAVTDGPYLPADEHVGGFWVIRADDEAQALAWGRRAADACRASVEVRPFHD